MKIITAILFFLSVNVFSQSPSYDAYIVSIDKDSICKGELLKITMHIDSALIAQAPNATIDVEDSLSSLGFYNMKCSSWVDSNFTMSFQIYTNTGLHKFWTSSDYNNHPAIKLYVKNCTAGIEQINSKQGLISTEYFNLLGQPISEPNGVTVEVKTYLGGYREVRKIVTQ